MVNHVDLSGMQLKVEATVPVLLSCGVCGKKHQRKEYYITRADEPLCVVVAEKHFHSLTPEIYINALFGSMSEGGGDHMKRTTFSCRYGYDVEGQATPAFSLVEESSREELYGKRLGRKEALAHDCIDTFWQVIDTLMLEDREYFDLV